uniref:HTH CENPB-type domain-containing protein n=1 Tax=Phytophthora infestans TaxID=4787 RepID=Q572G0_PHYIN|nr:hypothetical protein PI49.0230 [Phytophthora infestans]
MQRQLVTMQLWEVIEAANKIHHKIQGNLRSVKDLTSGWYNRLIGRHPELSMRASEFLSRARNDVDLVAVPDMFNTLMKLVIEHNLDSSLAWNMDETSFISKHQSGAVLAVRGSANVWTAASETTLHLSVVAAISDEGRAAAPLYILPNKSVRRTALNGCQIPNSGSAQGLSLWLYF